jgi:hypothetical protein
MLLACLLWVFYNWFGYWLCAIHDKWDFADGACEWLAKHAPEWTLCRGVVRTQRFPWPPAENWGLVVQGDSEVAILVYERLTKDVQGAALLFEHPNIDVRCWALYMGMMYDQVSAVSYLEYDLPQVRLLAVKFLALALIPRVELVKALSDPEPLIRQEAAKALRLERETGHGQATFNFIVAVLPALEGALDVESDLGVKREIEDTVTELKSIRAELLDKSKE